MISLYSERAAKEIDMKVLNSELYGQTFFFNCGVFLFPRQELANVIGHWVLNALLVDLA